MTIQQVVAEMLNASEGKCDELLDDCKDPTVLFDVAQYLLKTARIMMKAIALSDNIQDVDVDKGIIVVTKMAEDRNQYMKATHNTD